MFDYHKPTCLSDFRALLGEGPVWIAGENSFYFVDILNRSVHRYTLGTGELKSWEMPNRAGFLLPVADGTFLAGLADGLHRFDPKTGYCAHACTVEPEDEGNRLNDGCVDRQGRIWFGTMDDGETRDSGSLYRVEQHGGELEVSHWDSGYTVSNGPALSPCGKLLYACDSPHQRVYVFDVDDKGSLTNKRVFVTFTKGYPDGVTVDSQGNIWCGTWGGAQVTRFRPDGTEMEPIPLPVSNVTKVAFGGEDLRTVFVTTARKGLSEDELTKEPQAGGVFAFRTDIPGQEQHSFRLK
ncbi:SMP-30/gluconolactonase/LRE family protein [Saccharibacter sp. 17.LH.SD]|uniref:SMP-30/gluconolactonase/LRE family protein n=1 Tax=Saccharibacter sp. 17.LH.SD TaxID=2689393 RepID=UPI00136D7E6E|nr:SMP-30/gluconolactonase/LRE family protein [Saccharibacter sp. 17.LH.SD]MXV44074.1 SMP-30/gluconolactonase/LRE family protein [Saccharibacter sp. 17.LH.SD]